MEKEEVWSCAKDEGRPLASRDQELDANRCKLLPLRAVVVSVAERAGPDPALVRLGETSASKPCSTKITFGAFFRNMPATIMRCGRTFRLAKTHPAHARWSGSETLSCSRSLVGYTIDTHGSEFSEATPARSSSVSEVSSVRGEKDVAVPFDAVQVTTKDNNKYYLVMNATKDALKSAKGFKYDRNAMTWLPENAPATTGSPAAPRPSNR